MAIRNNEVHLFDQYLRWEQNFPEMFMLEALQMREFGSFASACHAHKILHHLKNQLQFETSSKTDGKRKGYKVFGLIDYFTGIFSSKGHEGKLNGEAYVEFLKEVLSKTRKHIMLIQDGASYHKSKVVKEFFLENSSRITVYQLPSYSPGFNPIEKLWSLFGQSLRAVCVCVLCDVQFLTLFGNGC